ncbi:flagellin lysine-N-methylase [Tissierella praeacuta]|uniref:flagellin lysine-N-methylase n=1 Tax=Tissierella praeacuta TaxID=43131 RepID=UPI0028AAFA6B|nr:flagellin lysine-N-methylase [Tissierella praeacuta]
MEKKVITLIPRYFKEFKCIGTGCKDSCCIGWRVSIDKDTYKKYKKNKDLELRDIFMKNITRNRKSTEDETYGKIKMNENGECPFLDNKKLCKIQLKLGEEYLSNVCKIYPRKINLINNNLEKSLEMSCPEAVRICIMNRNIMEFDYIEEEFDDSVRISYAINDKGNHFKNEKYKYFWDIRIFSIGILQNRNFRLNERIILLGIFYKKVQELMEKNKYKHIPDIINQFNNMVRDGELKHNIENIPTNIEIQVVIANEFTVENVMKGITNCRYLECLEETLSGLRYKGNNSVEDIKELYSEGYRDYYEPYIKEKEYILENYLVNEYFGNCMPFGKFKTIWDSYIYICIIYSMLKLHLIGISLYNKELNDDIVLKLIESFSRVSLHDQQYIQYIIDLIKENKFDTLSYLTIMVKN